MIPSQEQCLQSPSPPTASDGTHARIGELEPIKVRITHESSDNVGLDLSLKMFSPDHEAEEDNVPGSEDLVTPASRVPEVSEVSGRTPIDELMVAGGMPMSSIQARSRPPKAGVRPKLNQRPNNPYSMDLQLTLPGRATAAMPTVKMHRKAGAKDTGGDSVVSEGEWDGPEIKSSGEWSDRSLEVWFLDGWELPSVSCKRRRAGRIERNSITLPECRRTHEETNTASPPRINYYTRSPSWRARRHVKNVEVSAQAAGSSDHYLRSSSVNDDPDEGDEAPEEGSLAEVVWAATAFRRHI